MKVFLAKRARPSMCTHQAQNWSKNWRKWVFRIEISEKCGRLVCLLGAHTFGARLGKWSSSMVPNELLISYLNSKNSKSYESAHLGFKKWGTFLNRVICEKLPKITIKLPKLSEKWHKPLQMVFSSPKQWSNTLHIITKRLSDTLFGCFWLK